MRKTKTLETSNKLTVDITGLQSILSLGRASADKIGEDAGAVIYVGRRKLYFLPKIEAFMERMTEA